MSPRLSAWQRWVQQPQNLWFREAFFQIHLWLGIAIGLYVVAISLSGATLVFYRQITSRFNRKPVIVAITGPRLTAEELAPYAERAYPGYRVTGVAFSRRADRPAMVTFARGKEGMARLFNPYNGADLGDPLSPAIKTLYWIVDFHDNLLGGEKGRLINGIGGMLVTLLACAGAVLWWPGKKDWRRSLMIRRKSGWRQMNWDTHSALGFWCFLFIFLWGVSGIYFSFPQPFHAASDFLFPAKPHSREVPFGDEVLFWMSRLHFGRFQGRFGWQLQTLWAAVALVPSVMFVTSVLMWWNRSLNKVKLGAMFRAPAPRDLAAARAADGHVSHALPRRE